LLGPGLIIAELARWRGQEFAGSESRRRGSGLAKEASATEDTVVEVAFEQLDVGAIAAGDHRYDIVAIGFGDDVHEAAITARGTGDLPLLAQVDGALRRRELVRPPGLDLDEDQRRTASVHIGDRPAFGIARPVVG